MSKVVVVWNEHPTEVVAGHHARKVAEILRDKYGHKVMLKKIPVAKTNYGIVSKVYNSTEGTAAVRKLLRLKPSMQRAQALSRRHKAPVFNFHCSNFSTMGEAQTRSVSEFRIGRPNERKGKYKSEIGLHGNRQKGGFIVEVPAVFMPFQRYTLAERRLAQMAVVFGTAKTVSDKRAMRITPDLAIVYHTGTTPLRHPMQQKFLDPIISEKIAAAIDQRIRGK